MFGDDPAAQARAFEAAGCAWLHLVDLDGAFAGRPVNAAAVEAILAAVEVPVQLGGGIRDRATLEAWLEKGVARVILGHGGAARPGLVREAARGASGAGRGRDRRARRHGGGRGLGGDERRDAGRPGAAVRGRRRGGDRLYRHRARRGDGRAERGGDGGAGAGGGDPGDRQRAGSPRWPTCGR